MSHLTLQQQVPSALTRHAPLPPSGPAMPSGNLLGAEGPQRLGTFSDVLRRTARLPALPASSASSASSASAPPPVLLRATGAASHAASRAGVRVGGGGHAGMRRTSPTAAAKAGRQQGTATDQTHSPGRGADAVDVRRRAGASAEHSGQAHSSRLPATGAARLQAGARHRAANAADGASAADAAHAADAARARDAADASDAAGARDAAAATDAARARDAARAAGGADPAGGSHAGALDAADSAAEVAARAALAGALGTSEGLALWALQPQGAPQVSPDAGPALDPSAQMQAVEAAAAAQVGGLQGTAGLPGLPGLQGLQGAASAPLNDTVVAGGQASPSRSDASVAAQQAMAPPGGLTDLLTDMQAQAAMAISQDEAVGMPGRAPAAISSAAVPGAAAEAAGAAFLATGGLASAAAGQPDGIGADLASGAPAGNLPAGSETSLQPLAAGLQRLSDAAPSAADLSGPQASPGAPSATVSAANSLAAEALSFAAAEPGADPTALLAAGQAERVPTDVTSESTSESTSDTGQPTGGADPLIIAPSSAGQGKDTAGSGDGSDAAQQRSALRAYQTASLGAPLDARDVARLPAARAAEALTAVGGTPPAASGAGGAEEAPAALPPSATPVGPQVNLVYAEAARATAELRGGGPPDGVPRQSVEFEQLPGHLAAKIALGEGRLQLQVTPPQYGTLDVDVRLQDGALFVSLRAESAAVVQHLERHLQDLGAQLESAGLTLGGMDLSARDAPGDAQAGNGAFGTADTAGTAGESFARSRSSRGPATSSQTRFGPDAAETLSPRRLGGIDVIA